MRLIDADSLRDDWLENGANEYVYDTNAVLDSIDDAKTIDAVPVVRCKDCIFSAEKREFGDLQCHIFDAPMNFDNFCSYGERKEAE